MQLKHPEITGDAVLYSPSATPPSQFYYSAFESTLASETPLVVDETEAANVPQLRLRLLSIMAASVVFFLSLVIIFRYGESWMDQAHDGIQRRPWWLCIVLGLIGFLFAPSHVYCLIFLVGAAWLAGRAYWQSKRFRRIMAT
jgi:uncharacterized membrane protein